MRSARTPGTAGARPLSVELGLAVRPVLVTLLAVLVLALLRFGAVAVLNARLDRYVDANQALSTSHDAMLDSETAVRGYLLTGAEPFLEPRQDADQRIRAANATLMARISGDSELATLLLASMEAQDRWKREWADRALAGPTHAAPALTDGKRLFDGYRRSESALATALRQRMATTQHLSDVLFAGGVALHLLISAAGLLAVRRQMRRLDRALATPLAAVLAAIRQVRSGDLAAVVPAEGPLELRLLAEELTATTQALDAEQRRADARGEQLERQALLSTRALDVAHDFTSTLDLAAVVASVGEGALSLSGMAGVRVWLVDAERLEMTAAYVVGGAAASVPVGTVRPLGSSPLSKLPKLQRGHRRSSDRGAADADMTCGKLALPMTAAGLDVGWVELLADPPAVVEPSLLRLLETLTTHAGTSIQAARLHAATQEMTRRDGLTGLLNRRQLDADLDAECRRFARYGGKTVLALTDIDHFKQINDTHGHPAGDDVLQELARLLDRELRTSDTAYRYGGEEFALILAETGLADATVVIERIRAAVQRHFAGRFAERGVTASLGIAELGPSGTTPEEMLAAADRALYLAKQGGRNRWSACGPVPSTPEALVADRTRID